MNDDDRFARQIRKERLAKARRNIRTLKAKKRRADAKLAELEKVCSDLKWELLKAEGDLNFDISMYDRKTEVL